MPGLVPGIHVFASHRKKDVDGRDEPGHDELIYQTESLVQKLRRLPNVKKRSQLCA
jgi:hypothetical protein